MRANGRTVNVMVKAHFSGLMGINMSDNGKTTNVMVKEYIISLMATAMRANGRTVNVMVKAHFSGLMDVNMSVNGRMTNAMDMARCTIRMARRSPVVGKWAYLWNNEIHSLIEGASDYCALYSQPDMLEEHINVAVRKT